jgi:hypothetical protein
MKTSISSLWIAKFTQNELKLLQYNPQSGEIIPYL